MEIKISEIYESQNNFKKVYKEIENLITGKHIKLYEFDDESKEYTFIDDYDVITVETWDNDEIIFFTFGPTEWDYCSIEKQI